jgi:hypothetical protein
MNRKQGKLKQAVEALATISFLDTDPRSSLADAVKIAEQALKDIERDSVRVSLDHRKGKAHIYIQSAAGNEAIVREIAPLVKQMIDAAAGRPIVWAEEKYYSGTSAHAPGE